MCSLVAACAEPPPPPPTALPTPTITPYTTPLPPVPTALPAGLAEENPIRIYLPGRDDFRQRQLATRVETTILEETSLFVEMIFVENQAVALQALCASRGSDAAVAFLDGISFMIAQARNCGQAVARARRLDTASETGESAILLGGVETSPDLASAVTEQVYCRVNLADVFSWTLPTLYLLSEGVPATEFALMRDFDGYDLLLVALNSGDCDLTALPETEWRRAQVEDRDAGVRVIDETPELPHGVLTIPTEIDLSTLDALVMFFVGRLNAPLDTPLSEDETEGGDPEMTPEVTSIADLSIEEVLARLFRAQQLEVVSPDEYAALRVFAQRTGLDFTQLGD